jgi:hypothetical protein
VTATSTPDLSVLLVTDSLAPIRRTLHYFRAQQNSARLEVVLVAPSEARLREDASELQGFDHVQIVEVGDIAQMPLARAEAVRAARAPLVLFAESHAYPRTGYVESLIRRHREGPWAVVGPAIANANPGSMVSWACLFLDYGRWVEADHAGVAEDVPGHNAAYKRSALLEFGADLPERMRSDSLMHGELRARGHQLYLEPEAVCEHLNVSRLGWALREHFDSGRKFAGLRARSWGPWLRLAFAGGSPLIPLVRLVRILRDLRRSGRTELLPQLLPVLILILVVSGAGEFVGYAFGPGRSTTIYEMELHKSRYTRRSDREHDADERAWPQ